MASNTRDSDHVSEVFVTRNVSSQAILDVFDALECEPVGRTAIKVYTTESGICPINPIIISLLSQKLGGTIIESDPHNDSIRTSFVHFWRNHCDQDGRPYFKVDLIDSESEMKIPVSDTAVIRYDIVGEHLAFYDFLINIGCLDMQSNDGIGGVLQNASLGLASQNGKKEILRKGPKAMSLAAQAVRNFFLGGQRVAYIMVFGKGDYGVLSSNDPVALDQACADLTLATKTNEGNKDSLNDIGLHNSLETIDYAQKINLGSKRYKLVRID
jgi:hypothetical protein